MKQHAEREILLPTLLCDKKGNLNPEAIGYARKPIIDCNLSGHFMRKKKWNYWCVYGEDILFSATISHLDYAAVCFVYFLEYETQRYVEKTIVIPLGTKVKMPTQVLETVSYGNSELHIRISYFNGDTHLSVTCPNFDGERLQAELTIHHPADDDSLNVVIPWNRQLFQFTAKHHTLPTTGIVKIGERRYTFNEEESYAVLDFGRGVWPREATWNWGMASQKMRGRRIGLNFGGKWTDGTGMTENAVFVDGVMTKIHEDVLFYYDPTNFMKPWTITSKFSDTVNLTFTPFFERVAKTDAKLIRSEVHQLVGYYNGYVQLENGALRISQMLGCIEEHLAKW
ncbi:DUF2804 domain-containing protein [Lysinibacillus sp. KU-BSD001]|uniref:DUF2804 domain-containing protein n=1 Tax=Lysinibacillus sp. KU-BSD001 TaxID=3141328 RepID=UPI0036EE4738